MEVCTSGEGARLIGVSVETIRSWADRGKVPCMKTLAGRRVFKVADLRRMSARRSHKRGGAQ